MMSRTAFASVGGFDPAFAPPFCHFDLCLKVVEKGYRNIYVPSAALYHLGHRRNTGPGDDAERFREKWRYLTDPDDFYGANLALNPPTFEFDPSRHAG
jgi:GT2 family glycosyltransferase